MYACARHKFKHSCHTARFNWEAEALALRRFILFLLRRETTKFDLENWVVEKDENKKQKKSSKESAVTQWQWQSMVENFQLAHQELSVIIELINTVETNDVVTVASMTRPKPLPNEAMSDLAVNMENAVNAGDMENAESAVNMENAESDSRSDLRCSKTFGFVHQHT
ncbi:hypothetical protein FF1_014227 [Malus domestica]